MKYFLITLILVLLPLNAFAEEGRNCSIGIGSGQISVDAERFRMSSAEQRLMQETRLVTSRTVQNKTNMQQISLGCMVSERWGVDLIATKGIEFAIDNTIALPDLSSFEQTRDLPVTAVSATISRNVKANTALGLAVNYVLPVTDAVNLRFGVGIHRITLNETSQITISDSLGRQFSTQGPSEKKSGNVPTLTIGAGVRIARDVNLVGQYYIPAKGVHAISANIKIDF